MRRLPTRTVSPAPTFAEARAPHVDELLLTCRECGTAFWTGIVISPALRELSGMPGDTYACPSGHVADYTDADMFHDRRSGDARRQVPHETGSVDRRHRERRAGEI
jgi:hypothetical protein